MNVEKRSKMNVDKRSKMNVKNVSCMAGAAFGTRVVVGDMLKHVNFLWHFVSRQRQELVSWLRMTQEYWTNRVKFWATSQNFPPEAFQNLARNLPEAQSTTAVFFAQFVSNFHESPELKSPTPTPHLQYLLCQFRAPLISTLRRVISIETQNCFCEKQAVFSTIDLCRCLLLRRYRCDFCKIWFSYPSLTDFFVHGFLSI